MKKSLVVLMAISLFAVTAPALAEEAHQHGATHQHKDEQCAKECDMLLRDCAQEVDSIHDRIRKLQVEINEKGASTYTLEELKILNTKLKESNELLNTLQKPR
jgi:peptidoglycan hydrolase CwlO-like protein